MTIFLSAVLKELRLLGRDRHGLIVLFVMPMAFMLIMSVALSKDSSPQQDARLVLTGQPHTRKDSAPIDTWQARGPQVACAKPGDAMPPFPSANDETHLQHGGDMPRPTSVQHSMPAWLIFGMFFILIPISNVIVAERQTHTLTRLRMAQAPAGILLAAKMLPYFLITQIQFLGMILLGKYLLPLLNREAFELTGSFWPYALLWSAISLAALGYGLLVSLLVKSTEQAVVLGGGSLIIMAALGGIMVPAHVMPDSMQAAARFSPMSWALRAFHELLLNQASYGQVHHKIMLLALFGGLCLTLATVLYQRQLRTQVRA
ncbi:MAG: ABC transporter permease [Lautropia sp.]|nr:ABC transporter permease [Lautropia sp.]